MIAFLIALEAKVSHLNIKRIESSLPGCSGHLRGLLRTQCKEDWKIGAVKGFISANGLILNEKRTERGALAGSGVSPPPKLNVKRIERTWT